MLSKDIIKENYMKTLKIISLILILSLSFSFTAAAQNSTSWYIQKRGNEKPGFPKEANFISDHHGLYIDNKSNSNGKKVLYLTFDAGYENGNIEKILDVLKDEGIIGAFFILNNLINKNPELVRRMVKEGHLVCNHTSNHKDISGLTSDEILANLESLESKFEDCTGAKMNKFFRFPEGKYSKSALLTLEDAGYTCVFWSMAYDDWDNSRQPNPEVAKQKLLSTTHEGAIILLHPTSETNAKILPDLIRTWRSMGYTFGSLNDIE